MAIVVRLINSCWFLFKWGLILIVVGAALAVPYFYQRMDEEGRILTKDWSKYDYGKTVFRPKLMEPEELQEGAGWAASEFYSRSSIVSRFAYNWRHPLIFTMMNASYRGKHRHALERRKEREAPRGREVQ